MEQLACIMEIFGVPSPELLGEAQRKKLFFGEEISVAFSLHSHPRREEWKNAPPSTVQYRHAL